MIENPFSNAINIGEKAFIFGGAYGNVQATKAILKKAEELGFSRSEIIFTGDMVAYCANPSETVDLIRNSVEHIIMGNCEEAISQGSDDCGCGFEEGTECSILSNQWYKFCLSRIDQETANWMKNLPKNLMINIGGKTFLVTHATPSSINQFIFQSNVETIKSPKNIEGYIVGHSGIPFISEIDGTPWLNSGAAGMPANDATPRVWYATITNHSNTLKLETHALEYDFQSAQQSMYKASLSNGYAECLENGIWPSHDVLPELEKSQTGLEIKPQKKALQRTPFKEVVFSD